MKGPETLATAPRFTNRLAIAVLASLFGILLGSKGIAQSPNAVTEDNVIQKLRTLNEQSPIRLDYNKHVQAYIEVYTVKRRDHMGRIIGRSELYFPLFEAYLDKYGLPLELKYLAIVESALDPRAKSTSGAMGLWQFLYNASRMFDLEVTSYVDERCDPVKSTEAACKYLQYLYRNFNDWHLALAAYNVGIGEVKKAIEKSGGKTRFWDLAPYLPEQARGYVPAFIAANYVMESYPEYRITVTKPKYLFHEIDSVAIEKSLTFEQIARAIDMSVEDLSALNPMFTKNYIPVVGKSVKIVLPSVKIPLFIREEKNLVEAQPPQSPMPASTGKLPVKLTHTVGRGEYFHKIAMQYHCRIDDIMQWNSLKTKNLIAGQKLTIWMQPIVERFFFIKTEVNNNYFVSAPTTEAVYSVLQ